MQFTTTVTQKGQATIPAPIRKKLGIKPNTKVIFELRNSEEISLKPVPNFLSLKGSIKSSKPFDIEAMEKAVQKEVLSQYVKKPN